MNPPVPTCSPPIPSHIICRQTPAASFPAPYAADRYIPQNAFCSPCGLLLAHRSPAGGSTLYPSRVQVNKIAPISHSTVRKVLYFQWFAGFVQRYGIFPVSAFCSGQPVHRLCTADGLFSTFLCVCGLQSAKTSEIPHFFLQQATVPDIMDMKSFLLRRQERKDLLTKVK